MRAIRLVVALLWPLITFGGLLFSAAPTYRWWRAWVFLGVVTLGTWLSMRVVAAANPAALDRRFEPPLQRGQPLADKLIVVALMLTFLAVVAFIPVDVFSARVFAPPPAAISFAGLALYVAGTWLTVRALVANAFAAPAVRHQAEHAQHVVDTGPYGVVRHPMYAGMVLLLIGFPLWLESYAAAILMIVPIVLLVVRIALEERLLRRELPGYDAYTRRVPHRLIPFVW